MNQQAILDLFKKTGGILEGHFLLSSGLHSDRYLQCAVVLQYPEYADKLCKQLAEMFKDEKIDLIIGPALGGIVVSYEVARHLLGCRSIFAEREDGKMTLRRGFSVKKGERVLVVEDVITTGGSVKEIIEILKERKADIVGVGAIVDRSNATADFGKIKFRSLIKLDFNTFSRQNCPLCKKGVPLTKPGSRPQSIS